MRNIIFAWSCVFNKRFKKIVTGSTFYARKEFLKLFFKTLKSAIKLTIVEIVKYLRLPFETLIIMVILFIISVLWVIITQISKH